MAQQFIVRYFDPARQVVVEEPAQADSERQLKADCAAAGRVLLNLRASSQAMRVALWSQGGFDVAWWCRELRTLLLAGMTVVEALETLQLQSHGGQREQIHAELLRLLREGQALSKAMRRVGAFPEVLVAGVTASERTSTLTSALEEFLRYDEMLQRLKRQAISAAIYPAVVITLGLLISLFLLLYVIPRFSRMYADLHSAMSVPTQLLLLLSQGMQRWWLFVVVGLLIALVALAWAARTGVLRHLLSQAVRVIGPLDRQWDHYRRAKLYQSLALMFKGGYTLDEALGVCMGLDLGARMGHGIAAARAELACGRAVALAFTQGELSDAVSERLLAVGERTGGFDAVLQTIADRHAVAFTTFVERATRIVEPLLLLIVALVVGGIVVMMYMPIFDIASGIR